MQYAKGRSAGKTGLLSAYVMAHFPNSSARTECVCLPILRQSAFFVKEQDIRLLSAFSKRIFPQCVLKKPINCLTMQGAERHAPHIIVLSGQNAKVGNNTEYQF